MNKVECIIEKIDIKGAFPTLVQEDYYKVRGKEPPRQIKSYYYLNTITGDKYYDIIGTFGWPVIERRIPGFVLIMASEYTENPSEQPMLYILAEAEERNVDTLFDVCLYLRGRYGYGKHPDLFDVWYADVSSSLMERADRLNSRLLDKSNSSFIVSPPLGLENVDDLELLVQTIPSYLKRDEAGRRKLELKKDGRLWSCLDRFFDKKSADTFPAIKALAFGVATLEEGSRQGEVFNLDDYWDTEEE